MSLAERGLVVWIVSDSVSSGSRTRGVFSSLELAKATFPRDDWRLTSDDYWWSKDTKRGMSLAIKRYTVDLLLQDEYAPVP